MVSATAMLEELKTGNQGLMVILFASCGISNVFYSPHWLTLLLHYFFSFLNVVSFSDVDFVCV